MEVISLKEFMKSNKRYSGSISFQLAESNNVKERKISADEAYDSLMVILISFYLMYEY